MNKIILINSTDIDTKENDTKSNKKRMKQPFKMERDYNGDIQNTDNADIQQYHDHWRMMDTTPRVGERNMNNDYTEILEQILPELIENAVIDETHEVEKLEKRTQDYPGYVGGILGLITITIAKENIEARGYSFEDIKNAIESDKKSLDFGFEDLTYGDDPDIKIQEAEITQDDESNMLIEIPYEANYEEY